MLRLRQSSLRAWLTCPAEYYQKYVLEMPDEFNPAMELGTHYHREVESYHLGRPYDTELIAPYVEAVQPVAGELIEQWFEYVPVHPILGTPLPATFSGTIDRVIPGDSLKDFKTSSSSWSQTKADKALPDFSGRWPELSGLQATAYVLYWYQEHGELLPFDFVILRKDKRTNGEGFPVKSVRTYRTIEQLSQFYDLCLKVIHDIENEHEWACTCVNKRHALAGVLA